MPPIVPRPHVEVKTPEQRAREAAGSTSGSANPIQKILGQLDASRGLAAHDIASAAAAQSGQPPATFDPSSLSVGGLPTSDLASLFGGGIPSAVPGLSSIAPGVDINSAQGLGLAPPAELGMPGMEAPGLTAPGLAVPPMAQPGMSMPQPMMPGASAPISGATTLADLVSRGLGGSLGMPQAPQAPALPAMAQPQAMPQAMPGLAAQFGSPMLQASAQPHQWEDPRMNALGIPPSTRVPQLPPMPDLVAPQPRGVPQLLPEAQGRMDIANAPTFEQWAAQLQHQGALTNPAAATFGAAKLPSAPVAAPVAAPAAPAMAAPVAPAYAPPAPQVQAQAAPAIQAPAAVQAAPAPQLQAAPAPAPAAPAPAAPAAAPVQSQTAAPAPAQEAGSVSRAKPIPQNGEKLAPDQPGLEDPKPIDPILTENGELLQEPPPAYGKVQPSGDFGAVAGKSPSGNTPSGSVPFTGKQLERFGISEASLTQFVEHAVVGTMTNPLTAINNIADVATILTPYLGRLAQETMVVLMLDINKQPIQIMRMSIGNAWSTAAHNDMIVGASAATAAADEIYVIHNHPSQALKNSQADETAMGTIKDRLERAGLTYGGGLIITDVVAKDIDNLVDANTSSTPLAPKPTKIKVTERLITVRSEINPAQQKSTTINSPAQAHAQVQESLNYKPGIVFLDRHNRIKASLPISLDNMSQIPADMARKVSATAERSNCFSAMLYIPGADTQFETVNAARNMRKLLNSAQLNLLDVFDEAGAVNAIEDLKGEAATDRKWFPRAPDRRALHVPNGTETSETSHEFHDPAEQYGSKPKTLGDVVSQGMEGTEGVRETNPEDPNAQAEFDQQEREAGARVNGLEGAAPAAPLIKKRAPRAKLAPVENPSQFPRQLSTDGTFGRLRGDQLKPFGLSDAQLDQFVEHATTGKIMSGVEKIKSADDAAHLLAGMRKLPQETVVMLIVDAKGRPIQVASHSLSTPTSCGFSPGILVGSAVSTPGAAGVYFVHNHPSGKSSLSPADISANANIENLCNAAGIKLLGTMAIAGSNYAQITPSGRIESGMPIPAKARKFEVPLTQRNYAFRVSQSKIQLSDPKDAVKMMTDIFGADQPGVLLVDNSNRPIASIPLSREVMAKMKVKNANGATGFGTFLAGIDRSNAVQAFVFTAGMDAAAAKEVTRNMSGAATAAKITVVDSLAADGTSYTANITSYGSSFQEGQAPYGEKKDEVTEGKKPGSIEEIVNQGLRPDDFASADTQLEKKKDSPDLSIGEGERDQESFELL